MEDYDLELEKIQRIIREKKPKTVLVQLPDGLKPAAVKIADELKNENCRIVIWAGTCFGACDIPNADVDLIFQFGHTEFKQ